MIDLKSINLYRRIINQNKFPLDSSRSIPGLYYHGVILSGEYGWYAVLNISESGMLQSPNYIAYWDSDFASDYKSIRDAKISELKYNGGGSGGLTPTALHYIYAASGIRLGFHPEKGSIKLTKRQEEHIVKRSNIEIKFEIERRRIASNAPSRLDSLFIADNKDIICRMFDNHPDLLILKVKIAEALRFIKVDSAWYSEYWKNRSKKYIKRYWMSKPYKENTDCWEYLVDGLLVVDDPEGLEWIRSRREELDQENVNLEASI